MPVGGATEPVCGAVEKEVGGAELPECPPPEDELNWAELLGAEKNRNIPKSAREAGIE
jgi:hypothetical protein